jgi:hypothetical protein
MVITPCAWSCQVNRIAETPCELVYDLVSGLGTSLKERYSATVQKAMPNILYFFMILFPVFVHCVGPTVLMWSRRLGRPWCSSMTSCILVNGKYVFCLGSVSKSTFE